MGNNFKTSTNSSECGVAPDVRALAMIVLFAAGFYLSGNRGNRCCKRAATRSDRSGRSAGWRLLLGCRCGLQACEGRDQRDLGYSVAVKRRLNTEW